MGKLLEKHKYYNYQIVGSIQVYKDNDFRAPEEDIIFKSTYYKTEKTMLKAMKQIISTYERIEETEYNSIFVGKLEKANQKHFIKYMRGCFVKYISFDLKHDRTYITSFRFYCRKKRSNRGKKYEH